MKTCSLGPDDGRKFSVNIFLYSTRGGDERRGGEIRQEELSWRGQGNGGSESDGKVLSIEGLYGTVRYGARPGGR